MQIYKELGLDTHCNLQLFQFFLKNHVLQHLQHHVEGALNCTRRTKCMAMIRKLGIDTDTFHECWHLANYDSTVLLGKNVVTYRQSVHQSKQYQNHKSKKQCV